MHTKTMTNRELPQTMGSTLTNITTTERAESKPPGG